MEKLLQGKLNIVEIGMVKMKNEETFSNILGHVPEIYKNANELLAEDIGEMDIEKAFERACVYFGCLIGDINKAIDGVRLQRKEFREQLSKVMKKCDEEYKVFSRCFARYDKELHEGIEKSIRGMYDSNAAAPGEMFIEDLTKEYTKIYYEQKFDGLFE